MLFSALSQGPIRFGIGKDYYVLLMSSMLVGLQQMQAMWNFCGLLHQ